MLDRDGIGVGDPEPDGPAEMLEETAGVPVLVCAATDAD